MRGSASLSQIPHVSLEDIFSYIGLCPRLFPNFLKVDDMYVTERKLKIPNNEENDPAMKERCCSYM